MNWKTTCGSLVMTVAGLAVASGQAVGAGAAPTCSQLTKAQIQPLVVHRLTRMTVKPVAGITYLSSAKQVGQTCVFADSETSNAFAVVVIGGQAASRAYQGDLHSLGPSLARVPVVSGGKAVRERADTHGSVGSAEVTSIKGNTYCAVIPQDGETPGEARLEKAAGATAAIGDKAYADIAAAIGTVCNRIYGSSSTNPGPALAALKKLKPRHSGGGLPVPALPSIP
ncbi:MAG TPA: hypothetical protein VLJ44_03330 [Gaiellaceae bacterium]|nr:hypothetical protein [Gaiellaceae bacterium]